MMKTVKRKANVGERILITNPMASGGYYVLNSVLSVIKTLDNVVVTEDNPRWVRHDEYEVFVSETKPASKSARITALETEVSAQSEELALLKAKVDALEKAVKYPLTARFDAETNAKADAILADIKRKATPQQKTQSPNQQRADAIKRAKAFVSDKYIREGVVKHRQSGPNTVEFVVNSEKKTVVALLRRAHFLTEVLRHKGIAKCDPSDVFNADIGKAIALGRALGVDVTEFTKAVQPTGVVVGQVVKFFSYGGYGFAPTKIVKVTNGNEIIAEGLGRSYFEPQKTGDVITDDTDAVYE